MTKKERAQVVELLRCAADGPIVNGIFDASEGLSGNRYDPLASLAFKASRDVGDAGTLDDEMYRVELLEAAQRIEEGSYP